jgi:GntR family transcriptional regulator/MocR family aminotransferase
VSLDRDGALPLHRQLFDALRQAILAGRLRPGTRLPSTRVMASDLGVARNTVMAAFEQLVAEGYLQARVGSGTTVTAIAPDMLLNIASPPADKSAVGPTELSLSARGRVLAGTVRSVPDPARRAFQPGLPAFDEFPFATWSRLLMRHSRKPTPALLGYGQTGGHEPLRVAISDYLGSISYPACCWIQATPRGWRSRDIRAQGARCSAPAHASIRCPWTTTASTWRRASVPRPGPVSPT